jgi:hypothetical protein
MCFPSVDTPQPSQQETQLYSEIYNLINQQQAYYQMMMPSIAHEMHYKIVEGEATPYEMTEDEQALAGNYENAQAKLQALQDKWNSIKDMPNSASQWLKYGPKIEKAKEQVAKYQTAYDNLQEKIGTYEGQSSQQWVKMTDEEWYNDPNTTDAERAEWDAYVGALDRYNKAIAGELPLSETLQQQKQQEFEQLKSAFPTIQGDTWETATGTDTIGLQNLSEFKKRWATVEEAERYGTLTSGAQTAIATSGLTTGMATQDISNISGTGGILGGNVGAYQSLLAPYQAYTQMGYQAQAQNQAIQNQGWASLIGLGGMLGAAAISSKKYKKNIKEKTKKDEDKALTSIRKTKSYSYKYKDNLGKIDREYLGGIAEESPDEITMEEKNGIFIPDKLELVSMGLKSLARKVEKLEKAS